MQKPFEIRVSRESANDDTVTLTEWYVAQGAKVKETDLLLSLDTSKAVIDVEAEQDGFVEILVPAGNVVAVGDLIGYIHTEPFSKPQEPSAPLAQAIETSDLTTRRFSKPAKELLQARGVSEADIPGEGLISSDAVLAFLEGNQALPEVQVPIAVLDQVPMQEESKAKKQGHPFQVEPEPEQPIVQPNAKAQPVGGFFSDARKSANERGKGLFWLGLNYFFRNYLLGHMARLAPLGLNLIIHQIRGVKMGKGVYIDPSATIETAYPENITIGDDVRITANAIIMTHIKAPHALRNYGIIPLVKKPVVLEDHCFIGVNAVIMPGVTIGRGSVVTSGSVVLTNVPPNVMVTGNPAKVVKNLTGLPDGNLETA